MISFLSIGLGWRGGFYGLFVPGGVFLGFRMGFLSFQGFFYFVLLSFLSICGVFWDLFLCRAASALSLWVAVLLFHELSSLLLCFPFALLLYVNHFS